MAPVAEATARNSFARLSPGPGMRPAEVAEHQRARVQNAMVELVGERGYDAVTMRDLTGMSKVSSRTFYQQFGGKEGCFLLSHKLVVRRLAKRIIAAQSGERDWEERLRLAFRAFARELRREPAVARLGLVEAYAAGPQALAQALKAERSFASLLAESFARAPGIPAVPQAIVEGIVAGTVHVARRELMTGRGSEDLEATAETLAGWAISCGRELPARAAAFEAAAARRGAAETPRRAAASERSWTVEDPASDRALLLSAVVKLVASDGYAGLTASRIQVAAGVSRPAFEACFSGVDDCYLTAAENLAADAVAKTRAAAARQGDASPQRGGLQALTGLSRQVAGDQALAALAFREPPAAGVPGLESCGRMVEELADSSSQRPARATTSAHTRPPAPSGRRSGGQRRRPKGQPSASGEHCRPTKPLPPPPATGPCHRVR